MSRTILIAACALVAAPFGAEAQGLTYRCVAQDGKKYYGSTIPPQCYGRLVEQLNNRGLVVRRIDPEGEAKEKADKEAALAKKKEDDAAFKDQTRRTRALLATYTSERDIEDSRARALADNKKAVAEVEAKIEALRKRREKYEKELEFYQDKKGKAKPPAKLADDIRNAEIDMKAQEDLLAAKQKEVSLINARYDEDKKRYAEAVRRGAK